MQAADDSISARRLDRIAVGAALRRLCTLPQPPWLHGEVAGRLAEHLGPLRKQPERVLDWWAGPGGGEAALRGRYPEAAIVAVEPDGDWLERRRQAQAMAAPWWRFGRGRNEAASAHTTGDADATFGQAELVWANMMLHFVADPPALFARWHGLLGIDGVVAFSCPGPGTLRELRELYTAAGWPAPTPGFIDMHDLGDMLVEAGFAEPVLDQETLTLRWKSADALLAELRQLGGNTAPDRERGLRTPRWRARLLAALGERADADGSIGLSFEIAYGHAFKPAPRARAGEPVRVPLETVRAMVRKPRPPR